MTATLSKRTYLPSVNNGSVSASAYDYLETHYGEWVALSEIVAHIHVTLGRVEKTGSIATALRRLVDKELPVPVNVRYDPDSGKPEYMVLERGYHRVSA